MGGRRGVGSSGGWGGGGAVWMCAWRWVGEGMDVGEAVKG